MPRKPDNPDRPPAITKRDLPLMLNQRTLLGLDKSHAVVDTVVELIVEALVSGSHVRLRGLGTLALRPIRDRKVRLPHDPTRLAHVKGRPRVVFYEAPALVAALKKVDDPSYKPAPYRPGDDPGRPFAELFAGRRRDGDPARQPGAPEAPRQDGASAAG